MKFELKELIENGSTHVRSLLVTAQLVLQVVWNVVSQYSCKLESMRLE